MPPPPLVILGLYGLKMVSHKVLYVGLPHLFRLFAPKLLSKSITWIPYYGTKVCTLIHTALSISH